MLKIYIYWHKCWCYRCGTGRDGTTSEDSATQLLICEPLSFAKRTISKPRTFRNWHTCIGYLYSLICTRSTNSECYFISCKSWLAEEKQSYLVFKEIREIMVTRLVLVLHVTSQAVTNIQGSREDREMMMVTGLVLLLHVTFQVVSGRN